ncbi:MAG: YigZ family protein [Oscillospiraceae bacterium]|nr:YigZ family protein [Oscillospiraceae bacterium]
MTGGYITCGEGRSEFTEKKSVFLGRIRSVSTEDEARAFLAAVAAEHPEATHHVFCYILREGNVIRFSDAGEPSGTAGKPALEVLTREGVKDVCLVITRFFGGIKLGAGGLVRAYAQSAKRTLDAAGKRTMSPFLTAELTVGYADWGPVGETLKHLPAVAESVDYGAAVTVRLLFPAGAEPSVRAALADRTAGRAVLTVTGEVLRPDPAEA